MRLCYYQGWMKNPKEYTLDVLIQYADILNLTNAFRRDQHKDGQIKGSKSKKYNIIKRIITKTKRMGKGLTKSYSDS